MNSVNPVSVLSSISHYFHTGVLKMIPDPTRQTQQALTCGEDSVVVRSNLEQGQLLLSDVGDAIFSPMGKD